MLIESFIFNKLIENDEREGFSNNSPNYFKNIFLFLLEVFVMVVAGFLAWDCYGNQSNVWRIILTILAVLFSGVYILFYVVYHIIMNVKCGKKSSS